MRLVCISDTHCFHEKFPIPEGDVLIHAGDMALSGKVREVQSCLDWLNQQSHKFVVAIAGNHDWAFKRQKPQLQLGRIHYLENSSVNIEGKNFYGSPVQPEFMNWAFNIPRGAAIKRYWDMIPDAGMVDVLVTHGPPHGILDQAKPPLSEHCGCRDLLKQVQISLPLVHVFGHIHGGYGETTIGLTHFVNASLVDEAYRPVNSPIVLDI